MAVLESSGTYPKHKGGNPSMQKSQFTNYDELPLFLSAKLVAQTLGISRSSAYELMHEQDFPALHIGSRIVVPKEEFCQWVERHTQGGAQ